MGPSRFVAAVHSRGGDYVAAWGSVAVSQTLADRHPPPSFIQSE